MIRTCLATLIVLLSIPVFAQNPITADSPFQVRYAANLNLYDSVVDITNTGASGGNICVNVYAIDPAEEMLACCTCTVTPDALESFSLQTSILSNTGTGEVPSSMMIKLLASTGTCNASSVASLAPGLAAWMTTTHPITTTTTSTNWWVKPVTTTTLTLEETPFTPSTLSAGELAHLTSFCAFIQANDSGSGICKGCSLGGK
jgi:hypothetical protein